jgi:hypothetical protein
MAAHIVTVVMTVVAMIVTVVETTAISAATAIHKYSAHNKHCIYKPGIT